MISPLIRSMLTDLTCPNEVLRDALLDEGVDVAKVYIVVGETGEYSDRADWAVAGFLEQEAAERLCAQLNQWLRDNQLHWDQRRVDYSKRMMKCPLDDGFQCNSTGAGYSVEAVDLRG